MGWGILGPALAMIAILAILIIKDARSSRAPVLTGVGTLVDRSIRASHVSTGLQGRERQLYLLTFRLSGGNEVTLYASEHAFLTLETGITGQLTWQKDTLLQFLPEE